MTLCGLFRYIEVLHVSSGICNETEEKKGKQKAIQMIGFLSAAEECKKLWFANVTNN